MRRANVTYEDVAAYCDEQVAKGGDPDHITCREVQDAVGRGSGLGTISNLIKQWREEHAQALAAGIALTKVEEGALGTLVKGIIARATSDAVRGLSEQVAERDRRLRHTAGELEAVKEENCQLTERVDFLEGQLAEAKENAAVLQAALATIFGVAPEPTTPSERQEEDRSSSCIDQDARPASPDEQVLPCSPLPPEAFGGSDQELALAPATGQAALPFSAAAENSNEGPEEKPGA